MSPRAPQPTIAFPARPEPTQRPTDARLASLTPEGTIVHRPRAAFLELLRAGDVLVVNDAGVLPSIFSVRARSGGPLFELRLAAHRMTTTRIGDRLGLARAIDGSYRALVFGEGDTSVPTELRGPAPLLMRGDELEVLDAEARATGIVVRVEAMHARQLLEVRFVGGHDEAMRAASRHGRPIQYAHLATPLALYDVWTRIAGVPLAFEPPSAGFVLEHHHLATCRVRDIEVLTLTHAAGISSTGDAALDRTLPWAEPYELSSTTAARLERARCEGRRIVAVGTSVVRAIESAAERGAIEGGPAVATLKLGPERGPRVVHAVLSGAHEPGSSHAALLASFVGEPALARLTSAMIEAGYRGHEFGDACFVERPLEPATTSRRLR